MWISVSVDAEDNEAVPAEATFFGELFLDANEREKGREDGGDQRK